MAATEFKTAARVEEVPPGTVKAVEVDGVEIALAHCEAGFFATQGHCIHLGGPLGEGRLDGCVVTCPWHGWQYDVQSGKNEFDHAIKLDTYEVRVEDGEVQVAV